MDHKQNHQFTHNILKKMANETGKSVQRIKRLIVIKQNQAMMRRFWELVTEQIPGHTYREMYYCPGCNGISIE